MFFLFLPFCIWLVIFFLLSFVCIPVIPVLGSSHWVTQFLDWFTLRINCSHFGWKFSLGHCCTIIRWIQCHINQTMHVQTWFWFYFHIWLNCSLKH
jgi:hypothetical protein